MLYTITIWKKIKKIVKEENNNLKDTIDDLGDKFNDKIEENKNSVQQIISNSEDEIQDASE